MKSGKLRLLLLTGCVLGILLALDACSPLINQPRSFALALGDLNGDGLLDAYYVNGVGSTEGSPDQVWFNDRNGIFTDSQQRLGNAPGREVILGDLNGDGTLDALVANTAQQPNLTFINDGVGTFHLIQQSWNFPQDAFPGGFLPGLGDTMAVAQGDLDNDGDLDAFISYCCQDSTNGEGDGYSLIWLNDGAGRFTFGQALASGRVNSIALGDLDGDGDLDAFLGGDNHPNKIWINQGGLQEGIPGEFSDSGESPGEAGTNAVTLGDLDGDGDLDAYLGYKGFDQVWLNEGGLQGGTLGRFSNSGQRLSRLDGHMIVLDDVDEDGDLDAFVVGTKDGEIWLNDGTANFTNSQQRLAFSQNHVLAMGDLDNDGDADVLVGSLAQGYKLWINQGGLQGGQPGQFSQER